MLRKTSAEGPAWGLGLVMLLSFAPFAAATDIALPASETGPETAPTPVARPASPLDRLRARSAEQRLEELRAAMRQPARTQPAPVESAPSTPPAPVVEPISTTEPVTPASQTAPLNVDSLRPEDFELPPAGFQSIEEPVADGVAPAYGPATFQLDRLDEFIPAPGDQPTSSVSEIATEIDTTIELDSPFDPENLDPHDPLLELVHAIKIRQPSYQVPERDPRKLKRLSEITPFDVPAPPPIGQMPASPERVYEDVEIDGALQKLPQYVPLSAGIFEDREIPHFQKVWDASNNWWYPLYFEDTAYERYGHAFPPIVQPIVSLGTFGAQVVTLPYQMTLDPPIKQIYPLGYNRTGEFVPYKRNRIPWNSKAAFNQAWVTTGLIFLIP